jgi:hypothetical protein
MAQVQKQKKQLAALNYRTTSHWPWTSKLFGKTPRTYGAELPDFDIQTDGHNDTDPVVRKLCCFDEYGATGLLGWAKGKKPLLGFVERK